MVAAAAAVTVLSAAAAAAPPPCERTPVFAHRGHPSQVENSASALGAALADGFGGAEIDIQLLAGRAQWALHHDMLPGRVVALPADRPLRLLSAADWRGARFVDQDRAGGDTPATLETALAALPADRPPGWRLIIEIKDFPSLDEVRSLVRQVERRLPLSRVVFSSLSSQTLGYLHAALPPGSAIAWVLLDRRAATQALGAREWRLIDAHGTRYGITREQVQWALDSGTRVAADPSLVARAASQLGAGLSLIVDIETIARVPQLADRARDAGVPLVLHASIGQADDFSRLLARLHHSRGFWPDALIAGSLPQALCRGVYAHLRQLQQAPQPAGQGPGAAVEEPTPGRPPRALPQPQPASAPFRFRW